MESKPISSSGIKRNSKQNSVQFFGVGSGQDGLSSVGNFGFESNLESKPLGAI